MTKLLKKLCITLAFTIFTASLGTSSVYAVETPDKVGNKSVKELSSITITNVDVPVAGQPLDKAATVTSAEGESWEIPIIWLDESAKTATVAEAGRRYVPTFAMVVPNQFRIKGMDASGKFPITFPSFLTVSGTDKFVYIVDPSTQILYIVAAPGYVTGGASYAPGQNSNRKSDNDSDSSSDSDKKELSNLEKYCDANVIDIYSKNGIGTEFLEWLLDVVINEIQPQAVNLLKGGFAASFGQAYDDELSSNIGLFVYHKSGTIDGIKTPDSALAFVQGMYIDDKYKLLLGIDAEDFDGNLVYADGVWRPKSTTRDTFDNTVVHEMMHAFMDDYTRYGMSAYAYGDSDGLPNWFIEGIATAVDNPYQYRIELINALSSTPNIEPDKNPNRLQYTADSVLRGYTDTTNPKALFDLSNASKKGVDNTASAYVSGYLACVYLGYLDAVHNNKTDIGSFSIDAIKGGLDDILLKLHGEQKDGKDSLAFDTIIKEISGGIYKNTQEFQKTFIKGDELSKTFVAGYLQKLENIDTSGDVERAHGSVLLGDDGQNTNTPLDRGAKTEKDKSYLISSDSGLAESDADDKRANTTGGIKYQGNGTHSYIYPDEEVDAAAKTDNAPADTIIPEIPVIDPVEAVIDPVEAVTDPVEAVIDPAEPITDPAVESPEIPQVDPMIDVPEMVEPVPDSDSDFSEPVLEDNGDTIEETEQGADVNE